MVHGTLLRESRDRAADGIRGLFRYDRVSASKSEVRAGAGRRESWNPNAKRIIGSCVWLLAASLRESRNPVMDANGRQLVRLTFCKSLKTFGVPDGIRTHVIAVKGRCPGPG